MATRIITASVTYASEAARDAASGWGVGDVVYVTGVGYTVYDGAQWEALGSGAGPLLVVTSVLTAAEIRTLWSVGYELLPEVPDFAYWPLSAFAVSHITDGFGDTAGQKLSLAGGSVYYMELGTGAAPALFTISKFAVFDLLTAVTDDSAGAVGPMRIDLDTMDLTAEVGDGTLDVTVFYRLVDVS